MKKVIVSGFLLITLLIGLATSGLQVKGGAETFDFTYTINYNDDSTSPQTLTGVTYGDEITFDSGTLPSNGYVFLGWLEQGKVNPVLYGDAKVRVTENMSLSAFFKPVDSVAVIFMDANQDFIDVLYADESGLLNAASIPDYSLETKPGLVATGWTDGASTVTSTTVFTEDTVVYVAYDNVSLTDLSLDLTNGTVSEAGPYAFNDVITVSANGTGTFNYWLKDGVIASLDEIYSFTMADNHILEAVYDEGFVANSDKFITVSNPLEISEGYVTLLGQFDLPEGEEIVEYGIIYSDYQGGITVDTPDVQYLLSNKYNPDTNEFVLSVPGTVNDLPNYRAFMTTIDSSDNVSITYSYATKDVYADDLFISEYIEGSGYNKVIEIFNGTGSNIDLSSYKLVQYNGSNSDYGSYVLSLSGILENNSTYVLVEDSADQALLDLGNLITNSSVLGFNGNDAVGLLKNDALIDIVGPIGSTSDFAKDVTLVRNSDIHSPSSLWNQDEWTSYSTDTFLYLRDHQISYSQIPVQSSDLPASITITGDLTVNEGEDIQLTETYPSGGLESVLWYSSNTSLLTVGLETGLVTGVSEGTATIYAMSYYDHSIQASYTIDCLAPVSYTVTFDSNEGSAVDSQSLVGGSLVIEPTDPTRTGFVFAGWYTDDSTFVDAFDFINDTVSSDFTLYAKWIEEFTVTYNSNGGSSVLTETVLDGNLATEPTNPTYTGYVFDGWYTDDVIFENPFDFYNDVVTSDLTLHAKWVEPSMATETFTEDLSNFNGATDTYTDSGSFTGVNDTEWTYSEARRFTDSSSYTIGGTGTSIMFGSSGERYLIANLSDGISSFSIDLLSGYTGGSASDRSIEIYINDVSIGTYTLNAMATVETFNISGINISGSFTLKIESIGSKQLVIDNITWETYSSGSSSTTSYTVTYDSNEGSSVSSEVVDEGSYATEPADPTRSGYTFDGWYTDDTTFANGFDFSSDTITTDITLYAKWIEETTVSETTTTITYSDTSMTSSYGDGSFTFEGISYTYTRAASFDGGTSIQMNGSVFYNTSPISNIQQIIITFNSSASSNSIDLYAGQNTSGIEIGDSESGLVRTYDFSGGTYEYFYINASSYVRIESIEIIYSNPQ